jgi:hypothetical protein
MNVFGAGRFDDERGLTPRDGRYVHASRTVVRADYVEAVSGLFDAVVELRRERRGRDWQHAGGEAPVPVADPATAPELQPRDPPAKTDSVGADG